MKKEPKLYLIRGLPGSGKSTLTNQLCEFLDGIQCEADDFFVNDSGVYEFDPKYLHQAHKECYQRAEEGLKNKLTVFVSNTFTTRKELKQYFALGQSYGVRPFVITTQSNLESIHSVPQEAMDRMRERFDFTCVDELYDEFFPKELHAK